MSTYKLKNLQTFLFQELLPNIILFLIFSQSAITYAQEAKVQFTKINLGKNNQSRLNTSNQGEVQSLSNQILGTMFAIDRNREGWNQTISYASDPSGDNGGAGRTDWKTITIAHDCDDLFVRYQTSDGSTLKSNNARYSLFIDVDKNPMTGYRGPEKLGSIGADILIQSTKNKIITFKFMRGVNQETWGWQQINHFFVSDIAIANGGRDIEYRIRILDLDVFNTGITGFNWIAVADYPTGILDFYPDGGNLGNKGSFNTYNINYNPMIGGFSNPERGFIEVNQTHSSSYNSLDVTTLQCFRKYEGTSLIQRIFYLENFVNSDISQQYLNLIQADFDKIRQAGLKIIPRFAYSESISGSDLNPHYGDASKERILSHINQLSNVLSSNSDVIALMQAGFIGLWGEWWFSDHFQPDTDWSNRADILSRILDILPTTRTVQLRAPRYKRNIFNDSRPLDQTIAHNKSYQARTGHHNDCFLSNQSDGGTYTNPSIDFPYLEEETKWVAMGGETCNFNLLTGSAPSRLECATALIELDKFNWSYLNQDFYKPTLQKWINNGCISEIHKRLGYHLTVLKGVYDSQVTPGEKFKFSFKLKNNGFSAPFNPRAVELIFRHTNGQNQTVKLTDDPRFWVSGKTHTVKGEFTVPDNITLGEYELFLNLPDPEPTLHNKPEYSIRLANEGIWEVETGYNKLNHKVTVTTAQQKKSSTPICEMGVDPQIIKRGEGTALWWWSDNLVSASIDNGIGSVTAPSNFTWFHPTQTTTYIMNAVGINGVAISCKTTITVR
ncbi:MAG: DUF4832 domain-containing protein [Methylococcales bacterium]|nr:DUF4832 domain-containing protein [Methylococcales bacterium]